jgi:serine/threonine-protein kinase RsbW
VGDRTVRRTLDADVSMQGVDAVQDLLASWWEDVGGVSPRVRFAFEIAVVEIAGNIVEHSGGADPRPGRRFTLDLVADPETLTATFADDGIPAQVDLDDVAMVADDRESGRGLALAVATADAVSHRYEDGRNIWGIECRRA